MRSIVRYAVVSLSFCGVFLLVSCGHKASTYTTLDGLKITSAMVPPDDTAELMEMKFWKFGIEVPKPGQGLDCRLEVRRNGKTLETLGGLGTSPMVSDRSTHVDAEVGLYPPIGDIRTPGKLKVMCKMDGGSGSRLSDNPFAGAVGLATGDPLPTLDGGLMLMSAGKTASWPPADGSLVLVCKFRVTPPLRQM